jgi:tetratricopeptide (TPR) repeat protein
MYRRRTLVMIAAFGIAPAFAAVNGVVSASRIRRVHLASEWAARGDRDLASGRPDAAAEAFRTAQEYARDRRRYGLPLARALVAAGRFVEAGAELLGLWSDAPGNGPVNLELGRLAARDGDVAAAVRYYHGAIDGAWETNATEARRDARLELARFLLVMRQPAQAQAELIALAGDLPRDASFVTDTGALLLLAGADRRALEVLEHALELDPHFARADRLAGTAAFRLGDYRLAVRHLQRAQRAGTLDEEGASDLETSARILALDPAARGIGSRERIRRVAHAYVIAAAWIARCASDAVAAVRQQLAAVEPMVTERKLARDPDSVDTVLRLIAAAESAAVGVCPPRQADERALALIVGARPSTP